MFFQAAPVIMKSERYSDIRPMPSVCCVKRTSVYCGRWAASSFCHCGDQYKVKSKAELNEVLPCFLLYISNFLSVISLFTHSLLILLLPLMTSHSRERSLQGPHTPVFRGTHRSLQKPSRGPRHTGSRVLSWFWSECSGG